MVRTKHPVMGSRELLTSEVVKVPVDLAPRLTPSSQKMGSLLLLYVGVLCGPRNLLAVDIWVASSWTLGCCLDGAWAWSVVADSYVCASVRIG